MPWAAPITTDGTNGVVAIHAALVPTTNGDGEVIFFGGDNHDYQNATAIPPLIDHSRRFNCRSPNSPLIYVQSPDFDLFCAGHAFLGDGRWLIAGGTEHFPQDAAGIHNHLHFAGSRRATIYNHLLGGFEHAQNMNPEPKQTTGGGRWYPTLVTLSTGEVLAFGGHPKDDDSRHNNNTPERYQSLTDEWVLLPPVLGSSVADPDLFPHVHTMSDGRLFFSSSYPSTILLNPWSGNVDNLNTVGRDADYIAFRFTTVLLPLVPGDGYQARILLSGGQVSQFLCVPEASKGWVTVPRSGSTANRKRFDGSATLLPTGNVLATGGKGNNSTDTSDPVFEPEMYTTPLNRQTLVYDPLNVQASPQTGMGAWTTINEPASLVRNYHSTALLMPDGRVWTAGGNADGQPVTAHAGPPQETIEIYDPPYPAGPRPTISSAPMIVGYNDSFVIGTTQANSIGNVALIRCGSATHSFNIDQRMVYLIFTVRDSSSLKVTAPPHGGVAPPGWYMLWIVDTSQRPCSYAKFVRMGGQMSVFTDRSHISLSEVTALLNPSPATIPGAFYVVLDGFSANDLVGSTDRPFPPAVDFAWLDALDMPVPKLSAQYQKTFYEAPLAPPNVLQRITLAYNLVFSDNSAFQGIAADQERAVRIRVQWGSSSATGNIVLFRKEHVYSLDGPTPWLSIDLRVLRVSRGGTAFTGSPNELTNADPPTFIWDAVQRFRGAVDADTHPFLGLSKEGAQDSKMTLADQLNGTVQDNFAFAKVRFRAPVGVKAADVKIFFRSFSTALTNLEYSSTTYPRIGNGRDAVPSEGKMGTEIVSTPFFMNRNIPSDLNNVFTFTGNGATEVVSYFGCWLDFNHNTTIRNRMMGLHQCLVSEIHYPPSLIPFGTTPHNNDQLSQRNLVFVTSDNPGGPMAHTIVHTFDVTLTPRPVIVKVESQPPPIQVAAAQASAPPSVVPGNFEPKNLDYPLDELFIRWGHLPREAIATIYMPSANLRELLRYAARRRPGSGSLRAVDDHTVVCRVGDATYVPLPEDSPTNVAGLLTVQLPPDTREGEVYTVTVSQVSGPTQTVVGSFEFRINVSVAEKMREGARQDLRVLQKIQRSIPPGGRWDLVFGKYVETLTEQLRALGAHPDAGHGGNGHGHGRGWIVQSCSILCCCLVGRHHEDD